MKNSAARVMYFAILALCVLSGCADQRLASTRYRAAWAGIDMEAMGDLLEDVDFETIGEEEWEVPEGVTLEALERFGPERFYYAGEAEYLGWGRGVVPDWIFTEVEDLSFMRWTTEYLATLARVQIDRGDGEGAARTLLAGYQSAMLTADAQLVISSIIGMKSFEIVDDVARYGDGTGVLTVESMSPVGAYLDEVNLSFHRWYTVVAIGAEGRAGAESIAYQASRKTPEEMIEWLDPDGDWEDAERMEMLELLREPESVAKDIELFREYHETWQSIFIPFVGGDADAKMDRMEELVQEVRMKEHGLSVYHFTPALWKVWARRNEAGNLYYRARDRYTPGEVLDDSGLTD